MCACSTWRSEVSLEFHVHEPSTLLCVFVLYVHMGAHITHRDSIGNGFLSLSFLYILETRSFTEPKARMAATSPRDPPVPGTYSTNTFDHAQHFT